MSADRMQRQRFENKYYLTEEQAHEVRRFVQCHLELDENGIGKPNLSYPVHSLYCDSDRLATYWATINGDKNRFKLRIRFYNDDPRTPVFFEIKRRMDNCMMKQRGGVKKEAVAALLAGQLPGPQHMLSKEPKQLVAIQRFCELTQQLGASPKVHVAYQREAYVDPTNEGVRVTLDRAVLCEPRFTASFGTEFRRPVRPFGHDVILELKFVNRYPIWFRELVEIFGLAQAGAAKYCCGVADIGEEQLGARRTGIQTELAMARSLLHRWDAQDHARPVAHSRSGQLVAA